LSRYVYVKPLSRLWSGISECQRTYGTTDSGLTHLLHDLSPDGGTHPAILFCKLLAVTRKTKVTLSNRTELKQ